MNNEEAKFILSAYRPGGQDAKDPYFAEALEQAERDPALKNWFKEAQEFDSAVAKQLETVVPPADLRASILVGAEASKAAAPGGPVRRPVPKPVWAMAAIVVLCVGLLGLWMKNRPPTTPTFAEWQVTALGFLEDSPKLDRMSPETAELERFLRAANSPTLTKLPATLAQLKSLGCKTLDSDGHRISVMCFHRKDGKLIHLVISDGIASGGRSPSEPVFEQRGEWTTASWSEGDKALMLVTEGKPMDLAQYL